MPKPNPIDEDAFERHFAELLERIEVVGRDPALEEFRHRYPDRQPLAIARLDQLAQIGFLGNSLPQRIGRYEVIRRLGGGGMGVVYLVRDPSVPREVALKTLPVHLYGSSSARLRFEREVRAIGQLSHPGAVSAFEVSEAEGVPYFTMEFVPGRTLAATLRSLRNQDSTLATLTRAAFCRAAGIDDEADPGSPNGDTSYLHSVCSVLIRVAETLDAVHQLGILHRDVKPSNILIARDGSPRLFDFGLAYRDDEDDLTLTGDFVGTVHYVSPEQATGTSTVDERTDVYALGATLYELLTLEVPFPGPTTESVLRSIATQDPKAPRHFNQTISRDLETVCLTALEKRPSQRYASARAFADDLNRYRTGQAVRARPLGFATRTWRRVHRNKAKALAVALACLTLIGTPIGLLIANAKISERAKQAAAIAQSFEDVLLGSDVEELGKNATAIDLLHLAVERIEERLSEYPADAGRLLMRIGSLMTNHALHGESELYLERALTLLTEAHGEHHPDIAATANHLANTHQALGNSPVAERYYRQAIAISHRLGDPDELLYSGNLGRLAGLLGRYDESNSILEANLVAARKQGARQRDQVGSCLIGLGWNAHAEQQRDQAKRYADAAIEWLELDPETEGTVAAQVFELAGSVALGGGDVPAARRFYDRHLETTREVFPAVSAQVAHALNKQAILSQAENDATAALDLFRQALELIREAFHDVPDHVQVGWLEVSLGTALFRSGDMAAAGPHLSEAYRILSARPHELPEQYAYAVFYHAMHQLHVKGPRGEFTDLLHESESTNRAVFGENCWGVVRSLRGLAHIAHDQGEFGDSRRLLERCQERLDAIDPDSTYHWWIRIDLAKAHEYSGDLDTAEQLLSETLEQVEAAASEAGIARTRYGLARLAFRRGDTPRAEQLLKAAMEDPQTAVGWSQEQRRPTAARKALRAEEPVQATLQAWLAAGLR